MIYQMNLLISLQWLLNLWLLAIPHFWQSQFYCAKNVLFLSTYLKSYSVTHAVINVSTEFTFTENSIESSFNQVGLCCKYWLWFEWFLRLSTKFPMIISFLGHGYLQVKYENKTHDDIFKIIHCTYNIQILGNAICNAALFSKKHATMVHGMGLLGQMRKTGLPNGNSAK